MHLALVRYLLAEGQPIQAIRLLERLNKAAAAGGRVRKIVEISILKTCAFDQQGDTHNALEILKQALQLAEPYHFLRIFLDEGQQLINLLKQALLHHIVPKYVREILQSYYSSKGVDAIELQTLLDPLSQRERDVLLLLRRRMTNAQIAEALVISSTTVRTHLRNIYRKLNVHSRWSAIERARELELL